MNVGRPARLSYIVAMNFDKIFHRGFLRRPSREDAAFFSDENPPFLSYTSDSIERAAVAQMTCELISAAVTNVETKPSKAQQKFFSLHKRAFVDLTSEWADWKNCVCGTEEATGSKGCSGTRKQAES